ncbi:MAG: type I restriction enzyme HsdR N-terminal domain-containing protein [Tannerellaceae bacterium]
MLLLNLPTFAAKVVQKDGKQTIFDPVRRKYVALTPEEWVRQHFVQYLITEKGFPKELLANEVALTLNGTAKRCDTVVYDHFLIPLMIIEYKAPTIDISRTVFDQVARYNIVLRVQYLVVSNGMNHYCCKIDYLTGTYSFLDGIPNYDALENK